MVPFRCREVHHVAGPFQGSFLSSLRLKGRGLAVSPPRPSLRPRSGTHLSRRSSPAGIKKARETTLIRRWIHHATEKLLTGHTIPSPLKVTSTAAPGTNLSPVGRTGGATVGDGSVSSRLEYAQLPPSCASTSARFASRARPLLLLSETDKQQPITTHTQNGGLWQKKNPENFVPIFRFSTEESEGGGTL